jgi:hypothetical protein
MKLIDPEMLIPPVRSLTEHAGRIRLSAQVMQQIESFRLGEELPASVSVSYRSKESRSDWYRIELKETGAIEIACADERGVLYGLRSLIQVISQSSTSKVPCFTIEDWADFPVRSVMLDISRTRVPSMETLCSIIDICSRLKINQLQLYMEHTFAYSGHEKVWRYSSPFTAEEIREAAEYCRSLGIELVPNQNSFGHMERWLCHEEYKHLAEAPDGFMDPWGVFRKFSSTLAPSEQAVWPFLEDLYDQLFHCFPGNLFNAGGDEPWELCQGRSSDLCSREGLSRVYVDYLRRLHEITAARGRRMMVWADILLKYPEEAKRLPADTILVDWGYERDHPFDQQAQTLEKLGFDFYVCVGTSSWNSIGGRLDNCRENILNGAREGRRHNACGFMIADWGDNGHLQQLPVMFPGLVLGACAAWHTEASEALDWEKMLYTALREHEHCIKPLLLLSQTGEIYEKPLHNMTLPAAVLLDHHAPYYKEDLKTASGYDFHREIAQLDEIDRLIKGNQLCADELRWSSHMLRFACDYGAQLLRTIDTSIEQIPEDMRIRLSRQLEKLIEEYRRIWDLRSRPGGLEESSGILEALYSELGSF